MTEPTEQPVALTDERIATLWNSIIKLGIETDDDWRIALNTFARSCATYASPVPAPSVVPPDHELALKQARNEGFEEGKDWALSHPAVPPLKTHAGIAGAETPEDADYMAGALDILRTFLQETLDTNSKDMDDWRDDVRYVISGIESILSHRTHAPDDSDSSESRASQETARQDEPKPEIDSGPSSSVASSSDRDAP